MSIRHAVFAATAAAILGLAFASSSCDRNGGASVGGTGGAGGTAAAYWSCGKAAGICTCVPLDTSAGLAARSCGGVTDCCFLNARGACTCLVDRPSLDCATVKAALGAQSATRSCPP